MRGMLRPATVAIVGRPNVGKSALFNRLIGRRLAIVEDTPGVTRDRLYALSDWRGLTFSVVDTAGIDPRADMAHGAELADVTRRQAEAAAEESDVIVMVVDAQPDSIHSTTTLRASCVANESRSCSLLIKPRLPRPRLPSMRSSAGSASASL